MSIQRKVLLAGAGLLVLAGLGACRKRATDEYPPCPFQRLKEGLKWRTVDQLVATTSEADRPVYEALADEKFVDAYDLAAERLKTSPDSIPLRYAVAIALHEGMADFPDALYILRRLRHDLEERGRRDPDDETSREWYYHTLQAEASVLRDMDRYAEVLRAADRIDAVGPKDRTIRLWALVKEKRWDEAERAIAEAERDLDPWVRLSGMNARMAMEAERRRRTPCVEAARKARDAFPGSAVLDRTLGEASLMASDFDGAEKAYRKATRLRLDFNGTAWLDLAALFLQTGKVSKVHDALKKAQAQRLARKPYTRALDEAQFKAVYAQYLLMLGRSEDAELRVRGMVENPDRTGQTSTNKVQIELTNRLLLWLALKMRAEQIREEKAAGSWLSRTMPDRRAVALEAEAWAERCRVLRLVEDEDRLESSLRPYLSGNPSPWMAATLVELLPAGAAFEAVRRAREAEQDSRAAPYFDALEAEVALRLSRHDDALRLAQRALETLSSDGEKLLRARVSAVAAEALRRMGRAREARETLSSVLSGFPGVTRLLDLSIPVKIEHDGSAAGRRLAEALARSPRFRSDPEGFPVRVWSDGARLWFEMALAEGRRHFGPEGVALESNAEAAVSAGLRRFHQRVMSPQVDLTAAQINSLDGLQSAGQGKADPLLDPPKDKEP